MEVTLRNRRKGVEVGHGEDGMEVSRCDGETGVL
jgi:hypothetical protein